MTIQDPEAGAARRFGLDPEGPGTGARVLSFDDQDDFQASADSRRWGDGLPLVAPTARRVDAMVAGSGRDRLEVVSMIPPRFGEATIERIAVNAVMAGCEPAYMPVIVTAIEALSEPSFKLATMQPTTHPCGAMVFVSGPIAENIGLNGAGGCFGPGFKANATIGRAVRLVLMNIGGAYPQTTDLATQASPVKFSFCFTENQADSPWEPYHVSRGFAEGSSTVTVAAAEAPHNINDHVSKEPQGLLFTFAQTIATMGKNNAYLREQGDYFVAFCPEHAKLVARHGWTRADVQRYLHERARIPYREWRMGGMVGMQHHPRWIQIADDDVGIPMSGSPEDVNVLVAGGGGRHSSWMPTFGTMRSVTREIS